MSKFASSSVIRSFLLREKRLALVPVQSAQATQPLAENLVLAVQADLGQFGFALSGAAVAALRNLTLSALVQQHQDLVTTAKEAVGAHVRYVPLFRNFPKEVPEDFEYFFKRIVGYVESRFGPLTRADYTLLSCGHLVNHSLFNLADFGACPICQQKVPELVGEQPAAIAFHELTPVKLLDYATEEDVLRTFSTIARSRTSISDSYKQFVREVIQLDPARALAALPTEIPLKENVGVFLAALLKAGATVDTAIYLKTATDVLRLAVALCDGDVSLKEVTKFKLSNPLRQVVMRALDAFDYEKSRALEDMLRYRGRWLRLGEVLHIGKYSKRYPRAAFAFETLRQREGSIETFAGAVEKGLAQASRRGNGAGTELLAILSERPGELARRVDALLCRLPADEVLQAFEKVAPSVSTTILLTMLSHFRNRASKADFRAYMPKGSVAKMFVASGDTRRTLSVDTRLKVIAIAEAALKKRFSERPELGKVFVDDALASVLVPFSQRSASTGLAPMTRGSRFKLDPSKGFVRLFTHWFDTDESGDIDVDLGVEMLDEAWESRGNVSWYDMHGIGRTVHSGDVRSGAGPDGGCEFIDLDLDAFRKNGVRYVSVLLTVYTGQSFDEFPVTAGFMERDEPGVGKHFEPKAVKQRFAVTTPGTNITPFLVDVQTGEVLWADVSLKGAGRHNTVHGLGSRMAMQLRAIDAMQDQRISLKELFELHGAARGTLVSSPEEADTILGIEQLTKLDEVAADFL